MLVLLEGKSNLHALKSGYLGFIVDYFNDSSLQPKLSQTVKNNFPFQNEKIGNSTSYFSSKCC